MTQASHGLRIPFLGSHPGGEFFEYLLLRMNSQSALISIPPWVVNRSVLTQDERVNLHLRKVLVREYTIRSHVEGDIHPIESGKEGNEHLYRVQFVLPLSSKPIPEALPSTQKLQEKLLQLIKDSLLLKNGVYVYLKHLIPHFSRITILNQSHYQDLKRYMLNGIHQRVHQNVLGLEELYKQLCNQHKKKENVLLELDLERFKTLTLSEIDTSLFTLALEQAHQIEMNGSNDPLSNPCYSSKPHLMYISAIKSVELRLYDNYNDVVNIYALM